MSKYGDFSGPYFPVFGLNTETYSANLHIHSEYRKIRTRKIPYLDTFHAVHLVCYYWVSFCKLSEIPLFRGRLISRPTGIRFFCRIQLWKLLIYISFLSKNAIYMITDRETEGFPWIFVKFRKQILDKIKRMSKLW